MTSKAVSLFSTLASLFWSVGVDRDGEAVGVDEADGADVDGVDAVGEADGTDDEVDGADKADDVDEAVGADEADHETDGVYMVSRLTGAVRLNTAVQ